MRWLLLLSSSALGWVVLIVAVHRDSPRTAVSAHGFLHSAIAQRFAVDGWVVPPQNPFFAGEPLPYYWTFHALGAAVGEVLGLDPLRSFELLSCVAIVALVFGCGALARAHYGHTGLGAVIALGMLAGTNLQAPLVLAVQSVLSEGRVFDDPGGYLWGVAHPLLGHMRLWDPFATLGPLFPFYLNITARPLALSALAFVLLALHRGLRGGWSSTPALVAATAVCTGFSVLVGVPAALALGGALIALRLPVLGFLTGGQHPPIAPVLTGLALGVALGATSVLHLFTGGGTGAGVQLATPSVVLERSLGMLACAWPLFVLSTIAFVKATDRRRHDLATLLLAALALAGGTALFELPAGNHVNLFHGALVMLAVCAGGALIEHAGQPSRKRIAWAVACSLPVLALIVVAYTERPPIPLAFEARQLRRNDESHIARLYEWIRAATPPDTVVVIDPDPPIRAMGGNTAELPALTERTLFTARHDHYIVEGHANAARRAAIARQMLAGAPLGPDAERELAELARPILIVADAATHGARPAALDARYGRPAFASGPVRAWRWSADAAPDTKPTRQGPGPGGQAPAAHAVHPRPSPG